MTSAWQQIKTLSPLSQTLPSQKISHYGDTPAIIKELKHLQQQTAVETFLTIHKNNQERMTYFLRLNCRWAPGERYCHCYNRQSLDNPEWFWSFLDFFNLREKMVFHLIPCSTCSWTLTTFKGSSATWISYKSVLERIIKQKLDIGVDIWEGFLGK